MQCCFNLAEQNGIIANLEKCHALFVREDWKDTSEQNIISHNHEIKSEETVKLLGVTLDYKTSFDTHIKSL